MLPTHVLFNLFKWLSKKMNVFLEDINIRKIALR